MITKSKISMERCGELLHDPTVQRPLDPLQVRRMVESYDEHAIGTLTVSQRTDGNLYVVDGNHRCHVVMDVRGADAKVRCEVFTGLTLADEARLSRTLNDRRNWRYIDSFRLDVIAGDPVAVAVAKIVPNCGWEITMTPGRGHLSAIKSAVQVYLGTGVTGIVGPHPRALEDTLQVLGEAFGYDSFGVHQTLLRGVGMVFVRSGSELDKGGLVRAMQKRWGSPQLMLGDVKGFASLTSTSHVTACAEMVVDLYNKQRTTRRLAPWRTK